jgi:hypothetical protein
MPVRPHLMKINAVSSVSFAPNVNEASLMKDFNDSKSKMDRIDSIQSLLENDKKFLTNQASMTIEEGRYSKMSRD